MPIEFPPPFPTGNLATQDIYSISRYLNDPTMVLRALRTIADQIFVGNKVLTGQFYTDSGAIIYEQIETIFADRVPQSVAPGAEYPMSSVATGPAQIADVVKWGLDTEITDEAIARQNFDVLSRAFIKIVNSMVQQVDSVIMSAVVGAISQTQAASKAWNGSAGTPNILRDVLLAEEQMRALKQGYNADTVLCDLNTFATAISDPTLQLLLPREDFGQGVRSMPVFEGIGFEAKIAGKTWLSTPNLPSGTGSYAAVIDTKVFGAMVDERLPAPGYVGSQSDGSADDDGRSMIQVKTMREDKLDKWRIRARRVTTPIVIEPLAAVHITGV
ncbi:hypothetical protein C1Y40_05166 [Mycobacterium talmoniae]|uniref:Major capsid protein n=1 Tax=Mycobacterium talmoniae TaxID=1858794 RepID=A0A2S8BDD1_9MYCO|nr:hypothetical protein [Mycobacterium eburneum]PQM44670.1 hypothetical protein C1Y40_05166 [Mycobacterium talmoniae]TDH57543.1 hypothetical protein E2F47_01890 [Mycobacterium eburneum]